MTMGCGHSTDQPHGVEVQPGQEPMTWALLQKVVASLGAPGSCGETHLCLSTSLSLGYLSVTPVP